jgi:alpha-D-xyloside xylohydrolase
MFPDPAVLIQQVHNAGFKVCLWINSYIGVESPLLQEAIDKGYMLKKPDGDAWIGDLWGGYHPPVGIVDVTNPAAAEWFKGLLRPHLHIGADVFKTDFGEGVPPETIAHNGMTGLELHNLYPLIYNDLVAGVTEEVTGRPGLVWGRSTYAGGQRHAAQWGGDPNCTFQGMASTMRGGLSMGVCGHAFWSHDIGGFHHTPTPELYTRWAQFGLFSPLSRAHGMTTRLPWDYGEKIERIFREGVRLRYRLLPYIYTYAVLAHETGLPIMRAMVLEFPDDPCVYTLDLQYMFGSEILVAPIYNSEGRRGVYFPAGRWVDYWTHEIIAGPQTRFIQAPLDTLPLYVKADSLIPTMELVSYVADKPFEFVTFDAYLMDGAMFDLRDTDGSTRVEAKLQDGTLAARLEGAKKKLGLRVLPLSGASAVTSVTVNGKRLDETASLELAAPSRAGWMRAADGTIIAIIEQQE